MEVVERLVASLFHTILMTRGSRHAQAARAAVGHLLDFP